MNSDQASVLQTSSAIETNLPHFNVDIHVDGTSIFNNSEKPYVNAILSRIHSMKSSFYSNEKDRVGPPRLKSTAVLPRGSGSTAIFYRDMLKIFTITALPHVMYTTAR